MKAGIVMRLTVMANCDRLSDRNDIEMIMQLRHCQQYRKRNRYEYR